jgi:hypothetical protein
MISRPRPHLPAVWIEWIEWKKHNMKGTRWSILRSISGNMRYKVKIHGRETREFEQKKGYGQGPTSSTGKYNTSTEPLLQALEDAGAGVMVDGEKILGFSWSDDLFAIVPEENLTAVLECMSKSTKTFKKTMKASKSWAIPMCYKLQGTDRPTISLDGKNIPIRQSEVILGFTLSTSIQGTRTYAKRLRTKARIAIAKLEAIGIHNGHRVMPVQTEKYYNATVLAVIKACLAQHQLDAPNGQKYGYELARKMTAKVLRRMLGTSNRTSPTLLILEAGWDLPDRAIIIEKMTFHARMAQRTYRENKKRRHRDRGASNRKDGPSHVWQARLKQVQQGETRGLCAETKRLWEEADMANNWPPQVRKETRQKSKKPIQQAAKRIMEKRLNYELEKRSEMDGDTPYRELYDGTTLRMETKERSA